MSHGRILERLQHIPLHTQMSLFSEYLAKIELVCIYPRDAIGKASFLNEGHLVIIRCVEIIRTL